MKHIVSRSMSKPQANDPTGRAENVTDNLAANMSKIPRAFEFEWIFGISCNNHTSRQKCSPPYNVQDAMNLRRQPQKKKKM